MPLVFYANEPVSQIAYSLDGQANLTVTGNTTLTGLSDGEHQVIMYAWDEAGNVLASEIIAFTMTVAFTVMDAFQIVLVITIILTVIVVGIGLLFYFKKRRH